MGGGGRVCCSRLALGRQSQNRTRVKRPVKAIYIMYKRVNQSARWQHPRWAQAPWPGGRGTKREGQVVQHLLGTRGGGEEVPMAPPDTKTWREFLNNGTKLRLSPEEPGGPRAREWPQCSLCRGCAALAAAFLSFTVPRELHHVVLLLLLLFC